MQTWFRTLMAVYFISSLYFTQPRSILPSKSQSGSFKTSKLAKTAFLKQSGFSPTNEKLMIDTFPTRKKKYNIDKRFKQSTNVQSVFNNSQFDNVSLKHTHLLKKRRRINDKYNYARHLLIKSLETNYSKLSEVDIQKVYRTSEEEKRKLYKRNNVEKSGQEIEFSKRLKLFDLFRNELKSKKNEYSQISKEKKTFDKEVTRKIEKYSTNKIWYPNNSQFNNTKLQHPAKKRKRAVDYAEDSENNVYESDQTMENSEKRQTENQKSKKKTRKSFKQTKQVSDTFLNEVASQRFADSRKKPSNKETMKHSKSEQSIKANKEKKSEKILGQFQIQIPNQFLFNENDIVNPKQSYLNEVMQSAVVTETLNELGKNPEIVSEELTDPEELNEGENSEMKILYNDYLNDQFKNTYESLDEDYLRSSDEDAQEYNRAEDDKEKQKRKLFKTTPEETKSEVDFSKGLDFFDPFIDYVDEKEAESYSNNLKNDFDSLPETSKKEKRYQKDSMDSLMLNEYSDKDSHENKMNAESDLYDTENSYSDYSDNNFQESSENQESRENLETKDIDFENREVDPSLYSKDSNKINKNEHPHSESRETNKYNLFIQGEDEDNEDNSALSQQYNEWFKKKKEQLNQEQLNTETQTQVITLTEQEMEQVYNPLTKSNNSTFSYAKSDFELISHEETSVKNTETDNCVIHETIDDCELDFHEVHTTTQPSTTTPEPCQCHRERRPEHYVTAIDVEQLIRPKLDDTILSIGDLKLDMDSFYIHRILHLVYYDILLLDIGSLPMQENRTEYFQEFNRNLCVLITLYLQTMPTDTRPEIKRRNTFLSRLQELVHAHRNQEFPDISTLPNENDVYIGHCVKYTTFETLWLHPTHRIIVNSGPLNIPDSLKWEKLECAEFFENSDNHIAPEDDNEGINIAPPKIVENNLVKFHGPKHYSEYELYRKQKFLTYYQCMMVKINSIPDRPERLCYFSQFHRRFLRFIRRYRKKLGRKPWYKIDSAFKWFDHRKKDSRLGKSISHWEGDRKRLVKLVEEILVEGNGFLNLLNRLFKFSWRSFREMSKQKLVALFGCIFLMLLLTIISGYNLRIALQRKHARRNETKKRPVDLESSQPTPR